MMAKRADQPLATARACAIALCLTAGLSVPKLRADDGVPAGRFDLAPYRVMVRITFAADPTVTPALRQNVVGTLTARIGATFGPTWTLLPAERPGVVEDNDITPPDEQFLERLTYAGAEAKVADASCQKAYILFVRRQESRWLIFGREWDRAVQRLGPVLTATTVERRAISDAALGLLERLFSPLVIINDADRESKTATGTVRSGSIPPGDPSAVPLKKGALLLAYFRFLDSKGNVRKVQLVPWTYLVLDEFKDGRAKCAVASSYRAPLAANMRRRVEAVAILVRPRLAETRLKLVVGRGANKPLAGLFVDSQRLVPNQSEKEARAQPRRELITDRQGTVLIPADPQHPLRLLEIRSGTVLLARRPFVAGVDPDASLELADDETRLNAQRDVDLLRIQLIETVARRAALIARTRAALKQSDRDATQQLLADLDHLPKADFYLGKLNEIRVVSVEEAVRRRDPVSERRIEELCQNTKTLIEQYLAEDRLQSLHEEVSTSLAAAKAEQEALKDAAEQARKSHPASVFKIGPISAKKKQAPPETDAGPDAGAKREAAEQPSASHPTPANTPKPVVEKKDDKPQKTPSGL